MLALHSYTIDSLTAPDVMYYITQLSRKRPKFEVEDDNAFLDIPTKKAVLKAASSVVALLSYTGIELSNSFHSLFYSINTMNMHGILGTLLSFH